MYTTSRFRLFSDTNERGGHRLCYKTNNSIHFIFNFSKGIISEYLKNIIYEEAWPLPHPMDHLTDRDSCFAQQVSAGVGFRITKRVSGLGPRTNRNREPRVHGVGASTRRRTVRRRRTRGNDVRRHSGNGFRWHGHTVRTIHQ